MIDEALKFLRETLRASLEGSGKSASQPAPDSVTFLLGDQIRDSVQFPNNTVTALLIKLEEETILRPADPFGRVNGDGARQRVRPDIRLNLYVLFVAHFSDYLDSLSRLSAVVRYFQSHRLFTHTSAPGLSPRIDQLSVELVTLPFAEQNEIWGALRTSYRPSALYRVRMVVFRDEAPATQPGVEDVRIDLPA